jgi:hypothetical protein
MQEHYGFESVNAGRAPNTISQDLISKVRFILSPLELNGREE